MFIKITNKIEKNYRLTILLIVLLFNIIPFLSLYLRIEHFRIILDITTSITISGYGQSITNSPEFEQLLYHIFKFDYSIFFIYHLIIIATYYLLVMSKLDNRFKVLLVLFMNTLMLLLVLLFASAYIFLLIMLYNSTVLIIFTLSKIYHNQSIKLNLIMLSLITTIGVVLHQIIKIYLTTTINPNNEINERFHYDLNYIQSFSIYLLYDSLLLVYYILLFIIVIYLIYKLLVCLFKDHIRKRFEVGRKATTNLICFIFLFQFILPIFGVIVYEATFNRDRTGMPLTGCYKDYMDIGLGKSYTDEDDLYFDRCFDTSNGVYTVYWEVESSNHKKLDFIQEVSFKRIILFNEQGKEVLSFTSDDKDINIYVTTNSELEEGYDNLILVEHKNENNRLFSGYKFYNLEGGLVLELPYGIAERSYVKKDLLDLKSMRILFKEGQLIYLDIGEDDKLIGKYVYHIDGTKELIIE